MFQIRDFASIVAGSINWMKATTSKITDFSIGSVARTIIEAPAAEMDELYQNILIGLKEAIPVSVFRTFGFDAIPAEAASGVIRFSTGGPLAAADITIPAGTIVKIPGTASTYATLILQSLGAGNSYADVLVASTTAGSAYNTSATTITELATPITGIATVTNPAPLTNGRDLETDDERKSRFQSYISTLARGTKAAVEYGARTAKLVDGNGLITEYVAHASVVEPYVLDPDEPVSLVELYIHNGASATSGDLVAETQRVVDGYIDDSGRPVAGWKAAGVIVEVSAASDKVITVTGALTVDAGISEPDAASSAASAMKAYIQGLNVGETVIKSELIAIVMRDVPGVYNIVLSAPSADTTCDVDEKAIPGTVTLT